MDLKLYQCIQDIGKIIELMQVFSLLTLHSLCGIFSSPLSTRYCLFLLYSAIELSKTSDKIIAVQIVNIIR